MKTEKRNHLVYFIKCFVCDTTSPPDISPVLAETRAEGLGWYEFTTDVCNDYNLCPECQQLVINLAAEVAHYKDLRPDDYRASAMTEDQLAAAGFHPVLLDGRSARIARAETPERHPEDGMANPEGLTQA